MAGETKQSQKAEGEQEEHKKLDDCRKKECLYALVRHHVIPPTLNMSKKPLKITLILHELASLTAAQLSVHSELI